MTDKICSETK